MSKRLPKAKLPKIASGWQLWRTTVSDYFHGWKSYFGTMLVVAVPVALLSFSPALAADKGFTAYTSMAALILNLVIVSLALDRYRSEPTSIRHTYYEGTATLLRFIIICVVLGLCLIPAIIGLAIVGLAQQDGAGLPELVIIGLLGLILSAPSLWLLTRFGLSAIMIVDQPARPFAIMAAARRLTLGRFWPLLARLIILILWLVLVALIMAIFITLVAAVYHNNTALNSLSRLLLSLTVLPLGSIYLVRLYGQLVELTQ